MLSFGNYALCSDSVIMPKSNASIIGLAQVMVAIHYCIENPITAVVDVLQDGIQAASSWVGVAN